MSSRVRAVSPKQAACTRRTVWGLSLHLPQAKPGFSMGSQAMRSGQGVTTCRPSRAMALVLRSAQKAAAGKSMLSMVLPPSAATQGEAENKTHEAAGNVCQLGDVVLLEKAVHQLAA